MNPSIAPTGAPSNSPTISPTVAISFETSAQFNNVDLTTFDREAFEVTLLAVSEPMLCPDDGTTLTCAVTIVNVTMQEAQRRLTNVQLRMRKLQENLGIVTGTTKTESTTAVKPSNTTAEVDNAVNSTEATQEYVKSSNGTFAAAFTNVSGFGDSGEYVGLRIS